MKLTFGSLPDGVSASGTTEATVNITDDDTAGVTVNLTSLTLDEGGTATYTVVLDTEPTGDVTVTIQDPTDNTDVTAGPASLAFTDQNWDTAQTVTVSAAQDDNAGDETATITHTVAGYGTVTTADDVTVAVADDAPDSLAVSFGQDTYTVDEGSNVTVKVKLDEDPERTVTIPITATDQDGASGDDYSGVPARVTFNSGDTEVDISFSAASDNVDDDGESVKLTFGSLPDGVSASGTTEATVNITDDDTAGVTVNPTSLTLDEGGTATYTVVLDTEPTGDVTVTIQDPTDNTDVTAGPASLAFTDQNWDTAQTVTVSAAQDDNAGDETATITHTVAGYGTVTTADDVTVAVADDAPDSLAVSFGQDTYTVDEGSNVTVKVKLDADPERTVTIPITATDQDGASGDDYSGVPARVTFNSGDTEVDISFSAASDNVDDDGESVKLTFGSLPDGVSASGTTEATVNITDDDTAGVTVNPTSLTLDEGGTATYTVVLDTEPTGDVTVTIQDPTDNTDVTAGPASLAFTDQNWDTAQTVTVSAAQDDNAGDETATITHTVAGYGTVTTADDVTVAVADDAPDSLAVSFGQDTYTVAEGSSVTVKVKLDADPERTVTIPITATDQDGASGDDYSGVPARVTFNSGDTEVDITFSAASDNVDDDGESVKLTFGSSLPTGVTKGSTDEAVVNITDDDVPSVSVSFGQDTYTVDEGSNVTVKVKLDADPERTVAIPITTANRGGTSDSDYSGVPARVTFNSGDTEKSFTIEATEDNLEDSGESVKLGLGTLPTGVSAGTNDEASVSIANVSAQNSLTVNFGASVYGMIEGDTAFVMVTLSTAPGSEVTIPLTKVEQGGASSADYSGVPGGLTFGSSVTEKTFTFSSTEDTIDDDGESVKLGFGMLPDGIAAGSTSETTVDIIDDDAPATVEVSFEQDSYTVDEGSSVTVKVKLDEDPERTVTIPITATDQDGASGDDYSGVPARVTFNSGDTEVDISFSAASDNVDDDGESVKLTFGSSLPTGVTKGSTDEAVVSITDDDVPSVSVSFGQDTYTVDEGSNVTVKVKLDADPERTVTIPITATDQDGASGDDYSGVPARVTFNSGDTEVDISFSAASDNVDDDGESVKLTFGSLPDGVSASGTTEATVNITDDDTAGVTVNLTSLTLDEGGTATYTVVLDTEPTGDVTVTIQDPTDNTDVTAGPASLAFTDQNWDTAQTVTVSAAQDDNAGDETATITHTVAGYGTVTTADDVTVAVADDAPDSLAVSFGQDTYTVAEGSNVTVKVKLDEDPERTVTIPITATDQDGASGDDYSGVPARVTFNSGDTEVDISFSAASDNVDDDDGEREADLRVEPPHRCNQGFHRRGRGEHHGRRRSQRIRQLRAGHLHRGRGRRRNRHRDPERRPRAERIHSAHQDQPRRGNQRRLLRCTREPELQQRRDIKRHHLRRHPGLGG